MHNNDSLLANDMISEFEMNENTYNDEGKSGKDESTEDGSSEDITFTGRPLCTELRNVRNCTE